MSPCIVLTDSTVRDVLIHLSKDEIIRFRDQIAAILVDYSVNGERQYQPGPAVIARPDGRKTLFRPFTSKTGPGIKIIVNPAALSGNDKKAVPNDPSKTAENRPTLHGILAVCDEDGYPRGLVNADEVTAYRTSMSVVIPYLWRDNTASVVIFGAGKVALWHIRLMLGLRGGEIKRITVVNRSTSGANALASQVQQDNEKIWKSDVSIDSLHQELPDYEERLQALLQSADVICCTTPSTRPLFPEKYLKQEGSGHRKVFVSGVGSWQPEMVELDPNMVRAAAEGAVGTMIVDDRIEALACSGEIIQSEVNAEQMLELGELLRSYESDSEEHRQKLRNGFVVYKSIGVSLTDLASANAILEFASSKGKGIPISDF